MMVLLLLPTMLLLALATLAQGRAPLSAPPATCINATVANSITNAAILSLPDGNLPVRCVPNASSCAAVCCSESKCTGWTYTDEPRNECAGRAGACFPKAAPMATLQAKTVYKAAYTSGSTLGPLQPPKPGPPPSPPSAGCACNAVGNGPLLPASYSRPRLTVVSKLAALPDAHLRDPTTAVFDPVGRRWHVFCTHIPTSHHSSSGYTGTVWHFESPTENLSTPLPWKDVGQAVNVTSAEGLFDNGGVFTPAVTVECTPAVGGADAANCTWFLWFGGVPAGDSGHHENIGLATASSPYGPWKRYSEEPVLSRAMVREWCSDDTAEMVRVDEIKATIVQGRRFLAIKAVCTNFTALPAIFLPAAEDSWAPPYSPAPAAFSANPMISASETCQCEGFEEPTFYRGPDGHLHFLGHDHGGGSYAHFISADGSLTAWQDAGHFGPEKGHPWTEPNPIPQDGSGVFGDRPQTGVPAYWIDFVSATKETPMYINLCSVSWVYNGTEAAV